MNDKSNNDGQPVVERDRHRTQNSGVEELAGSQIDRRGFMGGSIAAGTVGVLGAGLFANQSLAGTASKPFASLHDLTCQDFERLVGQSFSVKSVAENSTKLRTEAVLTKVVGHHRAKGEHRPKNVRPHGFTLEFSFPGNRSVGEGTYVFGKGMTNTAIYVQPTGRQNSGHELVTAIFD